MATASELRRTSKDVLGKANAAGVLVILIGVGIAVGGSVGVTVVGVAVGGIVSVGVGVTVRVAVDVIVGLVVEVVVGTREVAVGFSASTVAEEVGCCEGCSVSDCVSVVTSINTNPTNNTIPRAMTATLLRRLFCSDMSISVDAEPAAGNPSAVQSV